MALKGHTKIELKDVETGEVEVYEKDNAITPYIQEIINFLSDAGVTDFYCPGSGELMSGQSWSNFFGCMCLFPERQDPNNCCKKGMELGWGRYSLNSNIGNANYQGLYNVEESVVNIPNKTVTMVWDFSTSQAIGTINSICLAPYKSFCQGNHGNIMTQNSNSAYFWGSIPIFNAFNFNRNIFSTGTSVYTDEINYTQKAVVAMRAGGYMLLSNVYYVTIGMDLRNKERYIISLNNNNEIQIHKMKALQKSLFYNPLVCYPDDVIHIKTFSLANSAEDVSDLYSTDGDTYTAAAGATGNNFIIQGIDMKNNTFDIVYERTVSRTGNVTATYYEYNVNTYEIKTGDLVHSYRFLQSSDTIPQRFSVWNSNKTTTDTYNCIIHQFTWRGVMYSWYAYNKMKAYDMVNDTILWDVTIPYGNYNSYDRPESYPNRNIQLSCVFDDYAVSCLDSQDNTIFRINLSDGATSSKCDGGGLYNNNDASFYTNAQRWINFTPLTLFLDYPHIIAGEIHSDNYVSSYSSSGAWNNYTIIDRGLMNRLTTVNNLQTPINKTNKKTMKISYTITET